VRRAHLASKSVVALVSLGVATYFGFNPGDTGLLGGLFAFLGALILILGPAGAVLEIAFGTAAGRIVFLAAAALALAGWFLKAPGDREPGPWGYVWIISLALVLMMGGGAVLLLRLLSRPRRLMSLRAALVDLADGEVRVFEQADATSSEEPEAEAGPLEVLPRSKLVYRAGEEVSPGLWEAPVAAVGRPSPATGPGTRRLSVAELAELSAARPRLLKGAIAEVVFTTWLSAFVLRGLENWASRSLDPRLSGIGWTFACALGLFVALVRFRRQRALAADHRVGVVARSVADGPEGAVQVETLPISKQPWAIDEVPAPWRTGRP